jgi:hypothetical protein
MNLTAERPVYRHIVVQRKNLVEHIDVEQLRRLRQQMDAGQDIDPDLKHLVVKDTLKKSVKKAMAWAGHGDVEVEGADEGIDASAAFAEAEARELRGERDSGPIQYQRQEGVVVSKIVQDHMPGDAPGTAMPNQPTYLFHPGFDTGEDRQGEFMRCAQELHARFQAFSDRKFLLMEPEMRAGLTLVTLVLTPIIAVPRVDVGVELLCEFHQKTRFGHVDTAGFDVFSEVGEFPVQVPSDGDMAMMFTTTDEFLSWEAAQRGQQ